MQTKIFQLLFFCENFLKFATGFSEIVRWSSIVKRSPIKFKPSSHHTLYRLKCLDSWKRWGGSEIRNQIICTARVWPERLFRLYKLIFGEDYSPTTDTPLFIILGSLLMEYVATLNSVIILAFGQYRCY